MSTATKTKENIDLNEVTRGIWEKHFGPWEEKGPKHPRIYREFGYETPHLDPLSGQPYRNNLRARTVSGQRSIDNVSLITWNGEETQIGYNVRYRGSGRPIKPKITMVRGQLVVHPKENPALVRFLDLCTKNGKSPVYEKNSTMGNPESAVKPEWETYDPGAVEAVEAEKAYTLDMAILEIYKMDEEKVEAVLKAMSESLPNNTGSVEQYVTRLRYYARKAAEKNPEKFMWFVKNASAEGVAVIHDARTLGLIGFNEATRTWWARGERGLSNSPIGSESMPKDKKNNVEQNIWALRYLTEKFPSILEWLESEINPEQEVQEGNNWDDVRAAGYNPLDYKPGDDGNIRVTKDGSPDNRYKK